MLLPTKSSNPTQESGGTSEETDVPSNNLWVGNLSSDVTQSDLAGHFAKFGALDSVTPYSARCYGFVFFKRMEDAMAAKSALQGTLLRGNSIKIEFARPVRSSFSSFLAMHSSFMRSLRFFFLSNVGVNFTFCIGVFLFV